MKHAKEFCLWLCFLLAIGVAASAQEATGSMDCAALREHLPSARWLSLPDSRLVVNPFLGPGGVADGLLPLNLAYYVGAGPVKLPGFWFVQPAEPSGIARGFATGQRLDLSHSADWQTNGVTAVFGQEGVRVTSMGDFGALTRTVTVDLDKTPYLVVQTPPGSPAFDMKVNNGSQPVDTLLHPTERLEAMAANVSAETGWHGVKTFQVLLYALGKKRPTTFTRVQFFGLPAPLALSESNSWMPHEVTSEAPLGDVGGKVFSAVTLPDSDTVSERLHIRASGPSALVLAGRFIGTIRWDAARNTLLMQGNDFRAEICVSRKAHWLGVRSTPLAWVLGEGQASAASSGMWRMALTGLKPGDDIVLTARFAPSGIRLPTVQASSTAFSAALARNEAFWNRHLALVPRPLNFMPRSVEAKGVTAAQVRRAYYRAWVFFFQDTLPPMPENGFAYPQVCTGKPSLWIDGATHMEETALWDGVAAMQALALVEPKETWAAVQGVLSQVDADGYLDGEALPTIMARTLWLLHVQAGDTDLLRVVYPSLKRFLLWKIANPRWIYPNRAKPAPAPNAPKDQEFVSYEIVDLAYAAKIAEALGRLEEAAFWRRQQTMTAADYRHWFLPVPGGRVYRIYGSDMDRSDPDDPWSLQGLQIDAPLLPPDDGAALVTLYKATRNPTLPFWVPGRTRFGDLAPIVLGLFRHGQVAESERLVDVCLRDVIRAGEFAEDYRQDALPVPSGVRPSAFGARLLTDSALWHNGVVLDAGLPILLGMPGAVGVDNIPVRGDSLSIRFGPSPHTVTLRGPGLAHLRLPNGFRRTRSATGETRWTGTIQEGAEIPLTNIP